ncbi:hypothetical protein DFR50_106124 [Roseiarcus fermentans]|uniref:Uncharacterized protein n=1 Tax=Roseiarcus fermentans TaxID=1473586 RepID=A0A366FNF3_9HYPH|nr:hypothetical protein [Roseiarcus fermentans]RBP16162.1 hypothetical protein DFR50_106124 [Roseiarcus fermentans]
MRKPGRSRRYADARRRAGGDERELQLLREFNRCGSVSALAGAIAARLGREHRPETLIADAGLGPKGERR